MRLGDSKLLERIQELEAELADADRLEDELEADLDLVTSERDSAAAERDVALAERDALKEQARKGEVSSQFQCNCLSRDMYGTANMSMVRFRCRGRTL